MAELTIILSVVATAVALMAFLRTVFQGIPTVEFLVEPDTGTGTLSYKLSVSNPTRRLIVLDHIEVRSPDTVTVLAGREHSVTDTLNRAYEDLSQADRRRKSVYLAVPAGQTKCLEMQFGGNTDEEDFDIDFRLVWSKGLPRPDQWLMRRKIKLDSSQVKSRRLAAVGVG